MTMSTPKPTWYTFFKSLSDSSPQLLKENSHVPDICCPQMVRKYIQKQPNIGQKEPCKGVSMITHCVNLWFLVTHLQGFMLSATKDT